MSILGNRVLRSEDPRLLTDGGRYTADLRDPRLDGALHAVFVRSTVAHAELLGVDVAEAAAAPGVVAVLTGADIDLAPMPGMLKADMGRTLLARDRVRFVGEPVAVVLAETPAQGEDAAELVIVDYEPLPAVVDPATALDGDTVLFPEAGTNRSAGSATRPARAPAPRTARSSSASASSTSAWRRARSRSARRPRPGPRAGWCMWISTARAPTAPSPGSPAPTGCPRPTCS